MGQRELQIFGIVWLLTLIILAIMTARDKEDGQESESAMQEYGRQVQGDETLEDAPVQGYSRQAGTGCAQRGCSDGTVGKICTR